MSNVYEIFKTNENLEKKKGITLEFGEFSFQILRAGNKNKNYSKISRKLSKKYKRQIETETIDDEIGRELLIKIYAESVVIDWKGIQDESGKDMPFTVENCIKLLTDLPDLFGMIHSEANNFSNFLGEATEKAKKS